MLLHFLDTYQGLLQEEEGAGRIIKVGLGRQGRWVSRLLALGGGPFEGAVLVKLGTRKKRCPGVFACMVLLRLKARRPCSAPALTESDAWHETPALTSILLSPGSVPADYEG